MTAWELPPESTMRSTMSCTAAASDTDRVPFAQPLYGIAAMTAWKIVPKEAGYHMPEMQRFRSVSRQ